MKLISHLYHEHIMSYEHDKFIRCVCLELYKWNNEVPHFTYGAKEVMWFSQVLLSADRTAKDMQLGFVSHIQRKNILRCLGRGMILTFWIIFSL